MAEFTMPSLGADMDSGTLVEWLVKEGDRVRRGDPMAVVDTDKSAIEVESFDDGVVEAFLVEPGTRVAVGTPLARLAPLQGAAPPPDAPTPPTAGAGPVVVPVEVSSGREATGPTAGTEALAEPGRRVSPYARRLAADLGVDLARLAGSGADGTIHAEDVLAARAATTEHAAPEQVAPEPVAQRPGPEQEASEPPERRGAGRETIAALMTRAKREIPHYYVATTVDLHALVEWLRRTNRERPVGDRLVPAAAILKATALAAREHPELNGFWVDDAFVPGEGLHLGVAVHVRDGALVAPAIHHTADLDLTTLMAALRDLVARARAGRLRRAELADPTLTVTDLGDRGVEEVIGVIYPPQVALLGVGRIVERPWAVGGLVGVRPTARLTLSGDHRATDGASGARFLNTLEQLLQHPEEL